MKIERTVDGPMGVGTELIMEPEDIKMPDWEATISVWFLTIPGQSILWSNYFLGIYHLRPMENVQPAVKDYEGITHEMVLMAMDPDKNPVARDISTWGFLRPINYLTQLELPSDEAAKELLYLAARGVVDGVLWAEPPLSGMKEPWRTAMLKTAAHLRDEPHAP